MMPRFDLPVLTREQMRVMRVVNTSSARRTQLAKVCFMGSIIYLVGLVVVVLFVLSLVGLRWPASWKIVIA